MAKPSILRVFEEVGVTVTEEGSSGEIARRILSIVEVFERDSGVAANPDPISRMAAYVSFDRTTASQTFH